MQQDRTLSARPFSLPRLWAIWIAIVPCATLVASEPSFRRDVLPILSEHCYSCHGPDEDARQADLRLDDRDQLQLAAGDNTAESELLRRITTEDPDEVMPPPSAKHALSDKQVATVRAWIQSGAAWEAHWSFVRPRRPALPALDASMARNSNNAIDHFVLAKLSAAQLPPNPPARPDHWLRRVTLDLTGLPPTLEELDAFVQGSVTEAEVVERLLASPRFGERMAMDWLDVARYADTNGYQGDRERTMWPWRDWVIDAFNRNLPYDEFTVWQIAGDLLPSATVEQKLATGFCRNHMINGEGGRIPEENRIEYIFDQMETVGTVWMGLTLQCCRCHDHKFDPLSQKSYYQLFAFFNQTPVDGSGGDPQMAPNMTFTPELLKSKLAQRKSALAEATAQLVNAERQCQVPVGEQLTKILEVKPEKRNEEQWKTLLQHFDEHAPPLAAQIRAYRTQANELAEQQRRLPKVMVMQDRAAQDHRETFILNKGIYNQPRDRVEAGIPDFLPNMPDGAKNRLALAQWLVSPEHPLTARVTVNRIWQMFFGTGLVKTTEDFGVQGEQPSHPELLDWLAVELIESGWDIQHLVRTIVTSATYRQSASLTREKLEADPDNRLLSRGPRRRMPAWMIRDHALFASGVGVGQLGGPAVKPYQPPGIWEEASFGNKRYEPDQGERLYRRSLYTYWRRIVGPTMFFDMARRQTCSVRTAQTNTPLHALVTLNDTTYVEAARLLAQRVMRTTSEPAQQSTLAFRLATGRTPTEDESQLLRDRRVQLQTRFAEDATAVDELLAVGDAPVPDDLDHVQLASMTTVCLTLLNLDEALNK